MKDQLLSLKIPGSNGTPSMEILAPSNIPHGTDDSITNLATLGVSMAMVIGIILTLAYLVYGGIYWIQSKGDKTKLDKARRILLYSILGLVVMSMALVVVNVLTTAIGLQGTTKP